MTHRTLTIAFFVKWNSIRVSLTRANGALLRSFFSSISLSFSLSLSLSHTRARARALKLRERANRKDRTTIIDETNSYILRRVGKFETQESTGREEQDREG